MSQEALRARHVPPNQQYCNVQSLIHCSLHPSQKGQKALPRNAAEYIGAGQHPGVRARSASLSAGLALPRGARGQHRPTAAIHRPTAAIHRPTAAIHRPTAAIHRPTAAIHRPTAAIHRPTYTVNAQAHLSPVVMQSGRLQLLLQPVTAPQSQRHEHVHATHNCLCRDSQAAGLPVYTPY
jgi:hypothetical protein